MQYSYKWTAIFDIVNNGQVECTGQLASLGSSNCDLIIQDCFWSVLGYPQFHLLSAQNDSSNLTSPTASFDDGTNSASQILQL